MYSVAFLATLAASAMASPAVSSPAATPSASAVGWVSPALGGGSMLDAAAPPLGEPLNVIISGLSSPEVLTDAGFTNFANSLELGIECLGLHLGGPQSANLGDGNGYVNQTYELRYDYGNAAIGTCLETLAGGNHLRMFRQNGSLADTGALFLAVSQEEDLAESHTISPNGYNIGRDNFVGSANVSTGTSYGGIAYHTTSEWVSGLLPVGTAGVNHNISLDGLVAVMTVTITGTSTKDTGSWWRRD
jgi:hypothetical protein